MAWSHELRDLLAALPDAATDAYVEIEGCGGEHEDQERLAGLIAAVSPRFAELAATLAGDEDDEPRELTLMAVRALAWWAWGRYSSGHRELRASLCELVPLVRAAATAGAASVRAASLAALAEVPWAGPEELEVVRRGLEDPEGRVRAAAVHAACRRLGAQAGPLVSPLVDDVHPEVERRVLEGLLALASRAVVPMLLRRAVEGRGALSVTLGQLRSIGAPESRPLLLETLRSSADDGERRQAAKALVEHVDAGCLPALQDALERGDGASSFAAMGLARLGPLAAGDGLLRWVSRRSAALQARSPALGQALTVASIYAVAAAGRRSDAPAILAALPGLSRRVHLVWAAAVLEHPDSFAPIVAAHASATAHERRSTALALGLQGDRRALAVLREAPADVNAALAVALVDPDAVDDGLVAAAASPWTRRIATFEDEALVRGFALRALGRRLRARGVAVTGPLAGLVRIVAAELEAVRDAEATALRCYRGRGDTTGDADAWCFLIADLHAEASATLQSLV